MWVRLLCSSPQLILQSLLHVIDDMDYHCAFVQMKSKICLYIAKLQSQHFEITETSRFEIAEHQLNRDQIVSKPVENECANRS